VFTEEMRSNMQKTGHFIEDLIMAWRTAGLDTETS